MVITSVIVEDSREQSQKPVQPDLAKVFSGLSGCDKQVYK